jgi:Fe-S-cluster containining protein
MECRRCGVCCTKHQAFVTPEDVDRISNFLGITLEDWDALYDDSRWRYSEYRLIRQVSGACAFLEFAGGLSACRIHAVKPACCAKWQPGPEKKECKEGMEKKT